MHFDTATRQRRMRALAYNDANVLNTHIIALKLTPDYELIRAPESGLMQVQARMGGIGNHFSAGDTTPIRAIVRLKSGALDYNYLLGCNKQHAGQCVMIDASLQEQTHLQNPMETLVAPLETKRGVLTNTHRAEIDTSRVDFSTLTRGGNA